jgi:hypothetical protein
MMFKKSAEHYTSACDEVSVTVRAAQWAYQAI